MQILLQAGRAFKKDDTILSVLSTPSGFGLGLINLLHLNYSCLTDSNSTCMGKMIGNVKINQQSKLIALADINFEELLIEEGSHRSFCNNPLQQVNDLVIAKLEIERKQ
jgi:hypothetical protein